MDKSNFSLRGVILGLFFLVFANQANAIAFFYYYQCEGMPDYCLRCRIKGSDWTPAMGICDYSNSPSCTSGTANMLPDYDDGLKFSGTMDVVLGPNAAQLDYDGKSMSCRPIEFTACVSGLGAEFPIEAPPFCESNRVILGKKTP